MNIRLRLSLLLLALATVAGVLTGCDSANPVAPNGTTLTVTANPTNISLNGTSTITVTGFKPDGNPLNPNTTVNLQTSIGTLDATTLSVNAQGQATTVLRPDSRTGTSTITATLASGGDTSATVDVQIGETEETRPKLLVFAEPDTITLNQTSTITVQARNADDSNFGAGGQITLRTSLGILTDTSIVTNGNGEASTTLTPGTEVGSATVTATLGASEATTVEVQFGATPDTRPTLLLSANPLNIGVAQQADITVLVRNADGTVFNGSGDVRLRTSLGSFSANSDVNTTDVSVSNGEATAALFNNDASTGTATVFATFDSSDEATIDITFGAPSLQISANPSNINLNQTSRIRVRALNPDGSPVPDGQVVDLQTDLGTLSSDSQTPNFTIGGGNGVMFAQLLATEVGTATVSANLGASDVATVSVEFGERQEERPTLVLTANPASINLEQNAEVTVQARNADGTPFANAVVNLRTTLGTLDDRTPTTDNAGQATVTLTPTDLSGTATVTGSVGSSDEVTVDIIVQRIVLSVTANPETVDTGETSEITIQVRDENNRALTAGYNIQLTSTLGDLSATSVTSDGSGEATVTYTAGTRPGTDTISAFTANSNPTSADISIRDVPETITLDVNPVTFTPSAAGTTLTLTARVTNAQGEPLGNEIVRFDISNGVSGTLDPAGGPTTDSNGIASATLLITETGIPAGTTSFTVTALVRGLESNVVTINLQ